MLDRYWIWFVLVYHLDQSNQSIILNSCHKWDDHIPAFRLVLVKSRTIFSPAFRLVPFLSSPCMRGQGHTQLSSLSFWLHLKHVLFFVLTVDSLVFMCLVCTRWWRHTNLDRSSDASAVYVISGLLSLCTSFCYTFFTCF